MNTGACLHLATSFAPAQDPGALYPRRRGWAGLLPVRASLAARNALATLASFTACGSADWLARTKSACDAGPPGITSMPPTAVAASDRPGIVAPELVQKYLGGSHLHDTMPTM